METEGYVITFESTGDAMRAETLLSPYDGKIIPVPQKISAGCGFAIKIKSLPPDFNALISHMQHTVYSVKGNGKERSYAEFNNQ